MNLDLHIKILIEHYNAFANSQRLQRMLDVREVFIRLGLGRAWSGREDEPKKHYIFITGVYSFPDYLEGKNYNDSRAAENVIPLVAVNPALWRTSEDLTSGQKDAPQGGESIIIDVEVTYSPPEKVPLPQVKVLSQAGMDEEVLVSEIDIEKTKEARNYWLSRRKPMLYNALCSQATFDV